MPRRPRNLESNVVYHIFNRRVDKRCLFDSDDAFASFLALLKEANDRYPVRLHAFCLMSTHWHMAASAECPQFLSKHVAWLAQKHAGRVRRGTNTTGQGHVYQDRFKSVPADGILHYVRLIRYIERNPVAAGEVARAENWRWSSLRVREADDPGLIHPGPWVLPQNWAEHVNSAEFKVELLSELAGQSASFRPEPICFD